MKEVLKNQEMMSHIAFSDCHVSKYRLTIDKPGHIMDGKKVYMENVVEKKGDFEYGDCTQTFSLIGGNDKIFDSYEEFIKHYNL